MWKAQHDATDAVLLFLVVLVSAVVARDDDRSQTRLGRAGRGVPGVALVATALCGCLSLAAHAPAFNDAPVKGSALVGAVGALAAGWNVWHTLMQKFGILRVYAAKSTVSLDRKTPAWVDRLFLFGSFPFLAAWLGPAQRHVLESQYKSVTQFLIPVADLLAAAQPVLLPLTGALWVASVALFVWHEWRADGLRTWPRLSMALALTLLNGTFFVVAPLKVYAAYGFSHAIEYMVFVQAFLQRRYASPVHGRPPIARLLRRPLLFWSVFSLLIGGTFFVTQFGKHYGFHTGGLRFLDVKISTWFFSFAVWGSMAHFYFDGFLWKVRTPHVRASL